MAMHESPMNAFDVRTVMSYAVSILLGLFVLYRAVRPVLKARAKRIMTGMLTDAGLVVGKDIVLKNDDVFLEWMRNGTLGFGETYMAGDWEVNIPLDEVLYKLLMLPYETKKRLFKSWDTWFVGLAARIFNFQSVSRASMIADAHYNLGNDFFQQWLDPNMQYSCAYWKDAENLEQAQLNKMNLLAKKLKLEPGMHVLDLGSGWGTLACHLAKNFGVKVTGVNISTEQVKFARDLVEKRGLSNQVKFLLQDYRKTTGEFDRVVSVGFLEHVGYKNMSEFYDIVSRCLKRGGLAVVQSITTGRTTTFPMDRWIPKYIFPNGYLPSPSLLALKAEMKLTVEDMQCFGMDYYRTLKAWYANYKKSKAGESRGVTFDRMWEYYLLYSAAGFRGRKIHLFQVVYSKHFYERYDAPR